MDDGDFPRTTASLGFDPTTTHPRVGDRDPRDEDRYLLLEALLAARDAFLVFWTGRDVRTNEVIAPAVPVGELVDVLEASFLPPHGWMSVSRHLTIHHPLQAFSPRTLTPGGLAPHPQARDATPHRLARTRWTFDRRLEASARQPRSQQTAARSFWPPTLLLPPESATTALDFQDLVGFWRQPVAWLVERQLGLWLRDRGTDLPGREPLELDPLETYDLKRALLVGAFDTRETTLPAVYAQRSARGLLPSGTPGRLVVSDAWATVEHAAALLAPHRGPTTPQRIDVDLGELGRLTGSVSEAGPDRLTAMLIGAPEGRKLFTHWLTAVALTASGSPTRLVVAWTGSSTRKPGVTAYQPFQGHIAEARRYLVSLAHWRREGLQSPLVFGPRSSWAFVTKKVERRGPRVGDIADLTELSAPARKVGSEAAAAHWYGNERLPGDIAVPALARVFGHRCPFLDEHNLVTDAFAELALGVWSPLLRAEESP